MSINSIPVYTAADWGYRGPLEVMLLSLDENLKEGTLLQVRLLTLPDSIERFYNHVWPKFRHINIKFISLDVKVLSGIPVYGHTGIMTYVRLLLDQTDICPESRALYLDADILVRGDITPLLEATKNLKTALGAVHELGTETVAGKGGVFNWSELGLNRNDRYFNAGVLGLNLELIRQEGLFVLAKNYLLKHGRNVLAWDQGALNAVAVGRITFWPLTWNYTTSMLKYGACLRAELSGREWVPDPSAASIAHFTGSGFCKPWFNNTISPFIGEYFSYAKKAGFALGLNSGLERRLGVNCAKKVRQLHAFYLGFRVTIGQFKNSFYTVI